MYRSHFMTENTPKMYVLSSKNMCFIFVAGSIEEPTMTRGSANTKGPTTLIAHESGDSKELTVLIISTLSPGLFYIIESSKYRHTGQQKY